MSPHGAFTTAEIFRAFLKLGLTAFGGPIAHLGYFRDEFVQRRRWLDEAAYAELVALCQFLPGPASSQVGFAIGLMRGGALGAMLAWFAFTMPSALFMLLMAYGAHWYGGDTGQLVVQGLKLVAVAIVAHALWGMARNLCPDVQRALIALFAAAALLLLPAAGTHVFVIAAGAFAGAWLCSHVSAREVGPLHVAVSRRAGTFALALCFVLLIGLPLLAAAWPHRYIELFEAFYRAGALVFGGGHVVLPLLEALVVGQNWTTTDAFLTGYGAAQAVPGPLFSFAAYLGATVSHQPLIGAALALVGIFLPGFLLLVGVLPFWAGLRKRPLAYAAIAGANAAVVGVLAAALYRPVWTSAIVDTIDVAIAAGGFLLLVAVRLPPWSVVLLIVAATVGVRTV